MSTEDEKLLKEAKKLSWDERLQHKNWKVRNDANIDLVALRDSITDPKDARLREFWPLFRKTVADSKALVQEKALDALLAFHNHGEETVNNQVLEPLNKHKRSDAGKKKGPRKKRVEQEDSKAQFSNGKSHGENNGPRRGIREVMLRRTRGLRKS